MLEEGNLDAAEEIKLSLEQSQRERRKTMELEGVQHEPQWFKYVLMPSNPVYLILSLKPDLAYFANVFFSFQTEGLEQW